MAQTNNNNCGNIFFTVDPIIFVADSNIHHDIGNFDIMDFVNDISRNNGSCPFLDFCQITGSSSRGKSLDHHV